MSVSRAAATPVVTLAVGAEKSSPLAIPEGTQNSATYIKVDIQPAVLALTKCLRVVTEDGVGLNR